MREANFNTKGYAWAASALKVFVVNDGRYETQLSYTAVESLDVIYDCMHCVTISN